MPLLELYFYVFFLLCDFRACAWRLGVCTNCQCSPWCCCPLLPGPSSHPGVPGPSLCCASPLPPCPRHAALSASPLADALSLSRALLPFLRNNLPSPRPAGSPAVLLPQSRIISASSPHSHLAASSRSISPCALARLPRLRPAKRRGTAAPLCR